MFSRRLPAHVGPTLWSQTVQALRQSGRPLIDLTETNPTQVGLDVPSDVASLLADPRGTRYEPDPLGLIDARQAVAATDPRLRADRLVLTASTSEAYSVLFKLLCDPGDEVLVPRPSYPLFDLLTGLEGVSAAPYRLDGADGWAIDRASVLTSWSERTRAVLVVGPNNPTGSMLRAADREWLVELAATRGAAIIADEVFADYRLAALPDAVSLAGERRALTFVLGGLSKSVGLPQMKLAWTAVGGPDEVVGEALERLGIIADCYLSVTTAVQLAAPKLLAAGLGMRRAIQARLEENLAELRRVTTRPASPLTLYPPEGGWSAVVRVPAILSDDRWVERLARDAGVLVHPGYFFDFEGDGFIVVSLIVEPGLLVKGMAALEDLVTQVTR